MNEGKEEQKSKYAKGTNNYMKKIFISTILIFVLLLIFVAAFLWQDGIVRNAIQLFKYRDSYQAVFLNNGQVYFGNIVELTNEYVVLEEPYSIKLQQKQTDAEGETVQSEVKLLSIKDEFYKPDGYMLIKKSEILFIEELQDSSQIIDIIENY
jgi:hypothetical protein